ncbi:MAG TPA: hypothetical protein PLL10_03325 [Elusimicrobiales bacterium]|nr:hypothetical protein [Elusimicrobiales bacterium]
MKNLCYVLLAAAVLTAACGAPVKENGIFDESQYYSRSPEGLQEKGKQAPTISEEAAQPDKSALPETKEPAPAPEPAPVPTEPEAASAPAAPVVPAEVSALSSHTARGSLEIISVTMAGTSVKIKAKVGNSTDKFWKRKWGYGFRFKFFNASGKLVSLTKKVALVDRDIAQSQSESVVFAMKAPAEMIGGGKIRVALVTEGSEIAAVEAPITVVEAPAPAQEKKPATEPEPLPEEPK